MLATNATGEKQRTIYDCNHRESMPPRGQLVRREGEPCSEVQLQLEVTGGFTGALGKQTIRVDLDTLRPELASQLRSELATIPEAAWGSAFTAPHPKPWDFRHVLRVKDQDHERAITFHLDQGPPALSRIARSLSEWHATVAQH